MPEILRFLTVGEPRGDAPMAGADGAPRERLTA